MMTARPVASHLKDAAVVVTGVGGGGQAGAAVAHSLARQGAVVHCIGRREEVRDRVAEITGEGLLAHAHLTDLSDFDATSRIARVIAESHDGKIALVAALAGGFAASGPVSESSTEAYSHQISINLTTAYSTARAFAGAVRAARGVFVFAASAAVLPDGKTSGLSAYAMAKSGVVSLVRTFAEEERKTGARVYAVAPTSLRTSANVQSMGDSVHYVELEDFSATIIAMSHPTFALATGQILKLG